MDLTRTRIRPYLPSDLDALYRICLLTGDDGQDASSLYKDPRLPGHFSRLPMGCSSRLLPSWQKTPQA